ncbi:MAG: LamG domain-containing protein, partial [Lentisphaeraceae bacterium]|nr:LamG domain-containing protein [Lentisphaeraceae bacterium]
GVTIEDLGTEFSVDYQENKNLDLYVFKGVVKIETAEENDSDKALLKAGEAIRVIYGRGGELSLAGIDHRNDLFIRQLETPNSKYSREIVKMEPVLYFPMDVVENGTLKDYSIYKNDGVSRGVADQHNFFAQGKFGTAINVSGANRGSYIFVDDYPKTKDSMVTGMAWVKAKSRPRWATIMKNWVDGSKCQFHFGLDEFGYLDIEIMPEDDSFFDSKELQTRDDVSLHGKSIHLREREKFPLNTWQHVAFVHDSKTLYLYRNGKLMTQLNTPAIKYPSYTKILSLGTKLSNNLKNHSSWKSHWDGLLDEVVIFNKAMSSKEIEYIYNQVYSNKMVD